MSELGIEPVARRGPVDPRQLLAHQALGRRQIFGVGHSHERGGTDRLPAGGGRSGWAHDAPELTGWEAAGLGLELTGATLAVLAVGLGLTGELPAPAAGLGFELAEPDVSGLLLGEALELSCAAEPLIEELALVELVSVATLLDDALGAGEAASLWRLVVVLDPSALEVRVD